MNSDFHYYATYCAAILAGYTHEESEEICYCAQLVDHCTDTFLEKVKGPASAATTQLQSEMADARTDIIGLQNITRIWASFHFLPRDLYADPGKGTKRYLEKYRLICGPNGDLLKRTVNLASGHGAPAIGIAMHVLADTWAHTYFAGTPSLVINNTDFHFFELIPQGKEFIRRQVVFGHNPAAAEDPEKGHYTGSVYMSSEKSIMNLGHGRAGHLPDYSFIRYAYMPAWGNYREIIKDNQADYYHAFCQMVYAMRYLRGEYPEFETNVYDEEKTAPYEKEIRRILSIRRTDDSEDWKALGERLSGHEIRPFDLKQYHEEYRSAKKEEKERTFLGRFFNAAMAQKSMVTSKIYASGNLTAGFSVDYNPNGMIGIRDFYKMAKFYLEGEKES